MKKMLYWKLAMIICFGCLFVFGCGGGGKEKTSEIPSVDAKDTAKNAAQVKRFVQDKMKKMEDKVKAMNAGSAYKMARKEAKKWNKAARLYELKGEQSLKPDGTAKQWTAYFAVKEDPENTPSREQGKKFVVLMLGGRIVDMQKKETPDEIAYAADCHAFLPDGWMSGQDAFTRCFAVLKDKYGDKADAAKAKRLLCRNGEYFISSKWEIIPTWMLSMEMDGSPVSAAIHALNGEVLKVK